MSGCRFCADRCIDADLGPLLTDELRWLWTAVAAAGDRRGDADLSTGRLQVSTPPAQDARAAAVGLLGGPSFAPGSAARLTLPCSPPGCGYVVRG